MNEQETAALQSQLRYFFENADWQQVRVDDRVLADPVYGAERVASIRTEYLKDSRPEALYPERIYRIGLERPERGNDPGGIRFIARFPHEACVRVLSLDMTDVRRIQAEAETLVQPA